MGARILGIRVGAQFYHPIINSRPTYFHTAHLVAAENKRQNVVCICELSRMSTFVAGNI